MSALHRIPMTITTTDAAMTKAAEDFEAVMGMPPDEFRAEMHAQLRRAMDAAERQP